MNYLSKFISLLLLCITCVAQSNESYELNWKLEEGKQLAYWTIMEEVDTARFNFSELFEEPSITNEDGEEIVNLDTVYQNTKRHLEAKSTLSVLEAQDDWLKVALIRDNFGQKKVESKLPISFSNGFIWRGIVNKEGGIESFYMNQVHKNQLALFFELPDLPVKVGDTWGIEASLLSSAFPSFEADSMYQSNQVKLLDVREEGEEVIAKLRYQIDERMYGSVPISWQSQDLQISSEAKYDATCEFSISSGKWLKYEGIYSVKSAGSHIFAYKQHYALIEVEEMPKQINQYLIPK